MDDSDVDCLTQKDLGEVGLGFETDRGVVDCFIREVIGDRKLLGEAIFKQANDAACRMAEHFGSPEALSLSSDACDALQVYLREVTGAPGRAVQVVLATGRCVDIKMGDGGPSTLEGTRMGERFFVTLRGEPAAP